MDLTQLETITYEISNSVAILRLNRPERLNAATPEMYAEMRDVLADAARTSSVRAVVIAGTGRAFCAGGDVKEGGPVQGAMSGTSLEFLDLYEQEVGPTLLAIRGLGMPTIAAVNGPAYGIGFDIALCCDLRIASQEAIFSSYWIRLGLAPAGGTFWTLPRIVGHARAMDMMLSGRRVEADEALAVGLVTKVVPTTAELEAESMALAEAIADGPPVGMKMTKELAEIAWNLSLPEALHVVRGYNSIALKTEDAREGLNAVRERRPPGFRGI